MKTRLVFLVLLIVCFSCGTNNKPVSDAQKEKIKGEVKEVVNTFIKGAEEANFELTIEPIDSTDFIGLTNGITYGYKEFMAMKPVFNKLLNQKCTIVNEKYRFLDRSTVLYTTDSKWSVNYKDGHSTLEDPEAIMILFKKIDGKWKVTYFVDSFIEKIVKYSEPSKEINQVELMKQFLGTWKGEIGKDTTIIGTNIPFGNGMECNSQIVTNGKTLNSLKQLFGYDEKNDKFIMAELSKSPSATEICAIWFTSKNTGEMVFFQDISNPENANLKWKFEFKSPDMIVQTFLLNNKVVKEITINRVGK